MTFYVIYNQRSENEPELKDGFAGIRNSGHQLLLNRIDKPADAKRAGAESVRKNADIVVVIGGDGMLPFLKMGSREPVSINIDGEPASGRDFLFQVFERRLLFCLPDNSLILFPPGKS